MSKKAPMRFGSYEYQVARKKEQVKQNAMLNYKDRLKVYLSFTIGELESANHPLAKIVLKHYPEISKFATLDDVRVIKMFDNMLTLSSSKALELSYKLDGSMSDLTNEPDYEIIEAETEGIK